MPQKPVFRFYLKPTPTSWYYIDPTGALAVSVTPIALLYDPIGWDDVKISWARSEKRWGLTRAFSTPLGFIKESARILRTIFAAGGIEGVCLLAIEKLQTYSLTYGPFYEGEIDFSNHADTDTQVQENIMEGGLAEMLRKKDNIPYEIEISGADVVNINNDGIVVGQYEVLSFSLVDKSASGFPSGSQFTAQTERSFAENPLGVDSVEHNSTPSNPSLAGIIPERPFYKSTAKGSVKAKVKGSIKVATSFAMVGKGLMVAVVKVDASSNWTRYEVFQNFESYDQTNFDFDTTLNIPIDTGDTLYLVAGVFGYPSGNFSWLGGSTNEMDWQYWAGTLEIEYPHRNAPYLVASLPYRKVFEKLIAKMSDGQFSGNSAFLSDNTIVTQGNRPFYTMVSSGDGIRGLADSKIKITLGELLQDAWSRWGLTIGVVSGIARLEPLTFFFQDVEIAHLGEVTDVKLRAASEFAANSLRIGYKDQNYGDVYGKDEFNAGQVYSLPVTRVQKEMDFTSPWRADMYGIETISRNLSEKEKQDASSDNETFLIEADYIEVGGLQVWLPYRPNNSNNTSGLVSPDTAYNLMLSPANSLRRIGPIIRSMLEPVTGEIAWQTSDRNSSWFCNIPGVGLFFGRADSNISVYEPLVFKPVWFEFESSIDDGVHAALAQTPNGYFSFLWRGHLWKAFPWNLDVKPALREQQTLKLLAHPVTDLSLAIQ